METPLARSLAIVIPGYRMHSQTFNNMLNDIQEADAQTRIENKTNHFTWMVGNLVNCRYWLAGILGLPEKDPNEDLFKDAKALDVNAVYPTLDELKKEWHKISPLVYQKLLHIDEAELMESYEFGMHVPYVEENKLNMVGMCMDRESYLFGQLGLMRKILNYPGVRYDVDDNLGY
ncbi:DinB family protein [Pedobacter sp. SYSU D00535]|uniref:DinB family protein n=1 Tax=Pedobacter sp. SYSU D00535 TaxID=2810308 RepID=UPI001A95C4EB|nr:DinB family protein [Pedobacter sp. SYSU D00535]